MSDNGGISLHYNTLFPFWLVRRTLVNRMHYYNQFVETFLEMGNLQNYGYSLIYSVI